MKDPYSVYSSIRKLKKHREDYSLSDMIAKKNIMEDSLEKKISLQREVNKYEETRLLKKDEIYSEIISSGKTSLKDLDNISYKIEQMKNKKNQMNMDVASAEKDLSEKREEYNSSREKYKFASSERLKIDELVSMFLIDKLKTQEASEMSEIDDISQVSFYFFGRGEKK